MWSCYMLMMNYFRTHMCDIERIRATKSSCAMNSRTFYLILLCYYSLCKYNVGITSVPKCRCLAGALLGRVCVCSCACWRWCWDERWGEAIAAARLSALASNDYVRSPLNVLKNTRAAHVIRPRTQTQTHNWYRFVSKWIASHCMIYVCA